MVLGSVPLNSRAKRRHFNTLGLHRSANLIRLKTSITLHSCPLQTLVPPAVWPELKCACPTNPLSTLSFTKTSPPPTPTPRQRQAGCLGQLWQSWANVHASWFTAIVAGVYSSFSPSSVVHTTRDVKRCLQNPLPFVQKARTLWAENGWATTCALGHDSPLDHEVKQNSRRQHVQDIWSHSGAGWI